MRKSQGGNPISKALVSVKDDSCHIMFTYMEKVKVGNLRVVRVQIECTWPVTQISMCFIGLKVKDPNLSKMKVPSHSSEM